MTAPSSPPPDARPETPPEPNAASPEAPDAAGDASRVDPRLLEILVCPLTGGGLRYDREACELVSPGARLAYPIRDGVPIMLVDEARRLDEGE